MPYNNALLIFAERFTACFLHDARSGATCQPRRHESTADQRMSQYMYSLSEMTPTDTSRILT
jgi:hypothetical protein